MDDQPQLPTPSPSFSSFNNLLLQNHHHRPSSPGTRLHHPYQQHAPSTPTPLRRSTTPTVPSASSHKLPPLQFEPSPPSSSPHTISPTPKSPNSKPRPSPLLRLLQPFTNAYYHSHSAPASPTRSPSRDPFFSQTTSSIKQTPSAEQIHQTMPVLHHPTPQQHINYDYESTTTPLPLSPANLQMHHQQQQQIQQQHQRPASRSERLLRDALIRDEKERQAGSVRGATTSTGARRNSRAGTTTQSSASPNTGTPSVSSRGSQEDADAQRRREEAREREREETYRGVFLFRTALSNPSVPRSASASPCPSAGSRQPAASAYWTGDAEGDVHALEHGCGQGATRSRPHSPAGSRSSAASAASRRAAAASVMYRNQSPSPSPMRKRQLLDQERMDNTPTPTPTHVHRPAVLNLDEDNNHVAGGSALGRRNTVDSARGGVDRERRRRSLQAQAQMSPHERHLREKLERMLNETTTTTTKEEERRGSKRSRSRVSGDGEDEPLTGQFTTSPVSAEATTSFTTTNAHPNPRSRSNTASSMTAGNAVATPSTSPLAHKPFLPAHRRASQSVSAVPQTPTKSPAAARSQSPVALRNKASNPALRNQKSNTALRNQTSNTALRSQSPSTALRSQSPSTPFRARGQGQGHTQSPTTPTGHRVRSKTEPATNFGTMPRTPVKGVIATTSRTPLASPARAAAMAAASPRRNTVSPGGAPSPRRTSTAPAGQGVTASGTARRGVVRKVIGTGTTPPLEPDVDHEDGILGGAIHQHLLRQNGKRAPEEDEEEDEDASLLTPPPTPPFTARMVAEIGNDLEGYCPSPYKASFESALGGEGVKRKLFGFAGRYGSLGGLGSPSPASRSRSRSKHEDEKEEEGTEASRDDLSTGGREMMDSADEGGDDEPPLSPVARLEERLFESMNYEMRGEHKRSQSTPGPMGLSSPASRHVSPSVHNRSHDSIHPSASPSNSPAHNAAGLATATFNARKASAHCRQIEGYVSFANVEGLGRPASGIDFDDEDGSKRDERGRSGWGVGGWVWRKFLGGNVNGEGREEGKGGVVV